MTKRELRRLLVTAYERGVREALEEERGKGAAAEYLNSYKAYTRRFAGYAADEILGEP